MDFTFEQEAAVSTHDQNLIVEAGAGSGKTRVLVERYLALLDAHPDWSLGNLVAITFTRKAAAEMRDRVRRALEDRFQAAADPAEGARWTALLTQIDGARIDTIHGLCADLLRANAADAGIDPDFSVLEEFDAAILRDDVVDAVLTELVETGGEELELLAEYPQADIRAVLTNADLLAAVFDEMPLNLFIQWQAEWEFAARDHVRDFMRAVEDIGTVTPVVGDLHGDNWQLCLDALDSMVGADGQTCHAALKQIDQDVKLTGGSHSNWGDKETLAEAKAALRAIRDDARNALQIIGDPPGDFDLRAAELLPLWAALLEKTREAYQAAKTRQGWLDFNDLELCARDLLILCPQVRQRYRGAEFRHLLVDEFQDTNGAQWEIAQALADLHTPGSLFVVGDPKQSIYAFRGADVRVFTRVKAQIGQTGGQSLPLTTSFRAHQPLVDCFNRLFGKLLVRDPYSPAREYQIPLGQPMTAQRADPPQTGQPAIELLLIDQYERDESGQIIPDEDTKSGALSSETRRRWEAFAIARRLHEMTDAGMLIYDREKQETRPVEYGDMAILFQSMSNLTLYEEAFKAMELPFVTVAGRGYYSRQEVWDLLNLLQAVYNPADDLAIATALRSPLFGLSDDALLALRLQTADDDKTPLPLWETLAHPGDLLPADETERVAAARDCLYHLRRIAGRVTIAELLGDALDRTGYLAVLTGLPDGARRRGNVEKLLEKAHSTGKTTLGEFSQYLQDLSAREVHEGEAPVDVAGAVSVMTVHASKGLEFPVVVLADASWERGRAGRDLVRLDDQGNLVCKVYDAEQDKMVNPFCFQRADYFHQQREAAERLRLLYVAATRAQDYLLIGGQARWDEKATAWKSAGWLARLLDGFGLTGFAPAVEKEPVRAVDFAGHANILRVHLPQRLPPEMTAARVGAEPTGWEIIRPPGSPAMPPLLQRVEIRPAEQARHLSATHLADLGSAEYADHPAEKTLYRERFLRQVFHDAPARIETVSQRKHGASARQIGEIVHESLRHWRIPGLIDDETLRAMLASYAWRQGITDAAYCQDAVERAYRLLEQFRDSDVFRWLADARQVYRELPFIYAHQGYVIHGVIDVLLQSKKGRWAIVDYKTSTVVDTARGAFDRHARRYHLQLGLYAQAVQEQLGDTAPATFIHYLRYLRTVKIREDDWRAALSRSLEERIQGVIGDGTSHSRGIPEED